MNPTKTNCRRWVKVGLPITWSHRPPTCIGLEAGQFLT
jgi:hypothetical protein